MKECKSLFEDKLLQEKCVFDCDGFRPNVGMVLCRPNKGLLWAKRQRMEALQAKKRQENAPPSAGASGSNPKDNAGYDSETSMNSAEFVRNQADNDFIDTEGDDADALNELYAEQHFDDDDAEAIEDRGINKKKISGVGSSRGRSERQELEAEADEDNPIMQAVNKMKRKRKTAKKLSELEDEAKPFLARMERAADLDEEANCFRRTRSEVVTAEV